MKKAVISFLSLGLAAIYSLYAVPSFADTEYYIEIGKDSSKDQAVSEWHELVAKHKSLLSHLQYYPKAVIESGVAVKTRIQAGPIATKAKAQKICSRLFNDDVPCFVIEDVANAPPAEVINLSERAESKPARMASNLPWLSSSEEIGAPPPVRGESNTLPWLRENTPKKGEVQVAEAIHVPLTDNFNPEGNGKVTVNSLPEIHPTFRRADNENRAGASETAGAGWLTVDAFPNEEIATSFWEEVHSNLPRRDRNLHVKVLKPLMTQNISKASLGIGPFASSAEAYTFCNTIQAKDRGLNCSYSASDTELATHGNAYSNRRMAEARKHPLGNRLGALSPAAGSKQYWVQVLSAASQMDALKQWEAIRARNSDMLNGMRSSVSASAADKSAYVVRVGPISNNDDAIKLCTQLQGRGVTCRVLLYSIGS